MGKVLKVIVKAMPVTGLWAYGRYFPHDKQEQLELSPAEYELIAKDPNLVSVALPEAVAVIETYKAKGK